MALVLQVTSGSRAGQRVECVTSVASVGRHPESDLRFDATRDLDVSTRHAEFRGGSSGWSVFDLGSTNGTWVNGERITAQRPIREGDIITFGQNGPRVEVLATDGVADAAPRTELRESRNVARPLTEERIAAAVERQTGALRRLVIGLGVVVVAGVGVLVWLNQKAGADSRAIIAQLLARNDSLVAVAGGREAGLDSIARELSRQRAALAREVEAGRRVAPERLQALEARTQGVISAAAVNWVPVHEANGAAVAMVFVRARNDTTYSGTAFGITADGLLVTNRHVVIDRDGNPPQVVAVQFPGQLRAVQANVEKVVEDYDLAFLQIGVPGTYPTVRGIARSGNIAVASPIAVIGFPLGKALPMNGIVPATTITAGILSKVVAHELQLDAFAAEGSSGSPVFDANGYVIGVVNSGNEESGGRVVFAVPGTQVIANLPERARGIVR